MPLQVGTRLGPYEIVAPIGAGGMGEVYKARDTRLDRAVAIKIVSPSLAIDPVFRERFDHEARTISGLDHPHICALYDVGRDAGIDYLVMQFLDGETLADRIARGPLPIGQALTYAAQMAAALDRAHRAGIVHRDLKPGNVMLAKAAGTSTPVAKLLDFGLAKAPAVPDAHAASRTMTSPLTGAGTIVGTLQYMAPEQLEGREVDARTDIFALGSIVYEMIAGRRAFEGASHASVMAAILEKEPAPLSQAQPLASAALDRIVHRALAKDPDARWQSASDLAAALEWVRSDSGVMAAPAQAQAAGRRRRPFAIAMGAAPVIILTLGLIWWRSVRPAATPRAIHSVLLAPALETAVPEISPDGTMILWSDVGDSARHQAWLQPLDSEAAQPISGTDGATYAFWSPDSRQIGFFADQKLKRLPVGGGTPVVICDMPDPQSRGGSWNTDDVIIFAGSRVGGISRVSASGGTPQPVTTIDRTLGQTTHRWPYFLPDGRHFLYFASANTGPEEAAHDAIMFASLDGRESRVLAHEQSNAAFADGRLLFISHGRLLARPFDPATGALSGEAVPILDSVRFGYGVARGLFAAAGSVLVAAPDDRAKLSTDMQWIARDGSRTPVVPGAEFTDPPRLSPDGSRLVAAIRDRRTGRPEIWTFDARTGAPTHLPSAGERWSPVWSRDNSQIIYLASDGRTVTLRARTPGGSEERVLASDLPSASNLKDCSLDYCVLSVWQPEKKTSYDLLSIHLVDGTVTPLAATDADENDARLSPDGHFVAYAVAQSGQEDVFVKTFPSGAGIWQVSTGGGHVPAWSPDGTELIYLTDTDVVGAPVTMTNGFSAGAPRPLISRATGTPDVPAKIIGADRAGDGRLLVGIPHDAAAAERYRLVLNWTR